VKDEAYTADVGREIYEIFFGKFDRGHIENLGLIWKVILKYTGQIFDGTGRNSTTWSFIICTFRKFFG